MRTRLIAGLTLLMIAAGGPALAAATGQSKHTCSFSLTARFAEVKVNAGDPPMSGSNTTAATLEGKLCGQPFHGAARDLNKYPKLGQFNGRIVNFGPLGSIRAKFAGSATLNPDHSDSLHGSGTITGGSGLYKGAVGSFTFTGTKPADSLVTTQHITGRFDY